MKTETVKLLSGAILLLAGVILFVFVPLASFLGAFFVVAGLVLVAPVVSWKIRLPLGTVLILGGLVLGVYWSPSYYTLSLLYIIGGLTLLLTLAGWKSRLLLGAGLPLAAVLLAIFTPYVLDSILLIVAGLVLLATLAHGKTTELKRPVGVTAAGVLALLGSVGLGFLALLGFALSAVGSYGSGGIAADVWLLLIFLVAFALAGLLLAIVVFQGVSSKYLWYALMAHWILLIAFSLIQDFTNVYVISLHQFVPVFAIWYLPTYVCPAICIVYFLTEKPRQYFGIKQRQSEFMHPRPTETSNLPEVE